MPDDTTQGFVPQLLARLASGVTKPAASLTDLIGLDKTAANLRARTQLLEDMVPRPEEGFGRLGAEFTEMLPSILASQAVAFNPTVLKSVGGLARRIPAVGKFLRESNRARLTARAVENPVLPPVNIFGP